MWDSRASWSTATTSSLSTTRPRARSSGVGFPGELVDGNDLFAVHDATARAVERARAGEGPTLIEARTYRMGPHNPSDAPTRYVDPAELERRREFDPVDRVRRYLTARGLVDAASEEALRAQVEAEIDAAVADVEGGPAPGVNAVFDHVYANPPRRVIEQRAAATGEG